jgi:hypothetical protein
MSQYLHQTIAKGALFMATKRTQTTEVAQTITAATESFITRLLNGHESFVEALGSSRARTARVTDKFVDTLLAGQRDALELSKAVTVDLTAYGKNMETFVHSLSTAQERAMDLAKTVYNEQAEAAAAVRQLAERALQTNKTLDLFKPLFASANK